MSWDTEPESGYEPCEECNGTGRWKENEEDEEIDCPWCKGDGFILTKDKEYNSKLDRED